MSADLESRHGTDRARFQFGPRTGEDEVESKNSVKDEGEEACRTPTSEEHKIPAVGECPPAPRKANRTVQCKRKLLEFDFFEGANRGEIDGFFRSSFGEVVVIKRKSCGTCTCK